MPDYWPCSVCINQFLVYDSFLGYFSVGSGQYLLRRIGFYYASKEDLINSFITSGRKSEVVTSKIKD